MSKRITYLQRREDLPAEDFSAHWRGPHAEIAVDLPGVVCYRQNHVVRTTMPVGGQPFPIDGIVELWFASHSDAQEGLTSAVTDQLVADEPKFLVGLTGQAVHAPNPGVPSPVVLWAVGQWRTGTNSVRPALERRNEWLREQLPGAHTVAANILDRSSRPLVREGLRRLAEIPDFAITVGFHVPEAADEAELTLRDGPGLLHKDVQGIQTMVSTTVSIVEPDHGPAGRSGARGR